MSVPLEKNDPDPLARRVLDDRTDGKITVLKNQRNRPAKRKNQTRKNRTQKSAPDAAEILRPLPVRAKARRRHFGIMLSFLLLVAMPAGVTFWYLNARAVDQFASTVGFSVRREEAAAPSDLLGGISGLTSDSSTDTDILYQFIQSQQIVERIDVSLGLRALFSIAAEQDPVFALRPGASIEELHAHWGRQVKVFYDGSNGLIEVRVLANTPGAAQLVAEAIFSQSSAMINQLSAIARDDTTRFAKAEMDGALRQLKEARRAITAFRNRTQIVDPNADIQAQLGLVTTLQQQLAATLIDLDLLNQNARESDPRIEQARLKIAVIRQRISEERKKFGVGEGDDAGAYASLINDYEALVVEREFAEQNYLAALTTYNTARAEARRQSRYLAAYIEPTLAETAQYPKRLTIFGLITFFLVMVWSVLVLVYYSVKDRR